MAITRREFMAAAGATCALAVSGTGAAETPAGPVSFREMPGQVEIRVDGHPFAAYAYGDDRIPRPYFHGLRVPGGPQVTRNHPPVEGLDPTDHDTFHPGLWMAYGDLGGADFWRNRATVRHVGFPAPPQEEVGRGTFTVANAYEAEGRTVCREECRFDVVPQPEGCLILIDSRFDAAEGEDVHFGDQEEMGLGVRMATPLTVRAGKGRILDSEGRENEAEVWGRQADWCDYGGPLEGLRAGVVLMSHPGNFRRSWFHARDYGLLVANPFGRAAFTEEEPSRVAIPSDTGLRLRFGVLVYGLPEDRAPALDRIYEEYARDGFAQ